MNLGYFSSIRQTNPKLSIPRRLHFLVEPRLLFLVAQVVVGQLCLIDDRIVSRLSENSNCVTSEMKRGTKLTVSYYDIQKTFTFVLLATEPGKPSKNRFFNLAPAVPNIFVANYISQLRDSNCQAPHSVDSDIILVISYYYIRLFIESQMFGFKFLYSRMEEDPPGTSQIPTSDPITKLIFKDFDSAASQCFELINESPFLENITYHDKKLLFDKAVIELVIVSKNINENIA